MNINIWRYRVNGIVAEVAWPVHKTKVLLDIFDKELFGIKKFRWEIGGPQVHYALR